MSEQYRRFKDRFLTLHPSNNQKTNKQLNQKPYNLLYRVSESVKMNRVRDDEGYVETNISGHNNNEMANGMKKQRSSDRLHIEQESHYPFQQLDNQDDTLNNQNYFNNNNYNTSNLNKQSWSKQKPEYLKQSNNNYLGVGDQNTDKAYQPNQFQNNYNKVNNQDVYKRGVKQGIFRRVSQQDELVMYQVNDQYPSKKNNNHVDNNKNITNKNSNINNKTPSSKLIDYGTDNNPTNYHIDQLKRINYQLNSLRPTLYSNEPNIDYKYENKTPPKPPLPIIYSSNNCKIQQSQSQMGKNNQSQNQFIPQMHPAQHFMSPQLHGIVSHTSQKSIRPNQTQNTNNSRIVYSQQQHPQPFNNNTQLKPQLQTSLQQVIVPINEQLQQNLNRPAINQHQQSGYVVQNQNQQQKQYYVNQQLPFPSPMISSSHIPSRQHSRVIVNQLPPQTTPILSNRNTPSFSPNPITIPQQQSPQFIPIHQYQRLRSQCMSWQQRYQQLQSQQSIQMEKLKQENLILVERIKSFQNSQKQTFSKFQSTYQALFKKYQDSLKKQTSLLIDRCRLQMKHNQKF